MLSRVIQCQAWLDHTPNREAFQSSLIQFEFRRKLAMHCVSTKVSLLLLSIRQVGRLHLFNLELAPPCMRQCLDFLWGHFTRIWHSHSRLTRNLNLRKDQSYDIYQDRLSLRMQLSSFPRNFPLQKAPSPYFLVSSYLHIPIFERILLHSLLLKLPSSSSVLCHSRKFHWIASKLHRAYCCRLPSMLKSIFGPAQRKF